MERYKRFVKPPEGIKETGYHRSAMSEKLFKEMKESITGKADSPVKKPKPKK